ncbi:MAG: aspartate-semialdehyde dehydrogenase [Ignavibacteria bacterium]
MKLYDIAVVGASGLVGRKILEVLEERKFPCGRITAIASDKSYGREITVNRKNYKLQMLTPEIFKNSEFAFFSAGAAISHEYAPAAVKERAVVIDNSSAFRMNDDVPLIVPEVNRQEIFKHRGIISNPNCSTIQLVMVLSPLDKKFRIKRVVVSTYQSVTGKGNRGITQLQREIAKQPLEIEPAFPHVIAYNAIPHVDVFLDNGYTKEEFKVIHETRKILSNYDINLTVTCVRVPTIGGHCESVNIEFERKAAAEGIRDILSNTKGIKVVDEPQNNNYPMPIDSLDKDDVFVGRIRKDDSVRNGINLWIVSDNVRKGAATNAVQIAEELIKGK